MMPLDECVSYDSDDAAIKEAMKRTHDWYVRSKRYKEDNCCDNQQLYGIVQGGTSHELRREAALGLLDTGVDGLSLGGLSVGEPKPLMLEVLEELIPHLPVDYPRYFMGIGKPEDLFYCVERGIDMMDCVLPTRIARNGTIFSRQGLIVLKNAGYRNDFTPLDPMCSCSVCAKHSRAYISHLFRADEILGPMLATIHNIHFMLTVMEEIRTHIKNDTFLQYKKQFFDNFFSDGDPLNRHADCS